MAKKKKLDDLEAELAALEAELAALEGKASDLAKKPKKAPAKAEPAAAPKVEAAPPEKPSRMPRLGLGRKKDDAPDDSPAEAASEGEDASATKPKKRFGLPKLKKDAATDAERSAPEAQDAPAEPAAGAAATGTAGPAPGPKAKPAEKPARTVPVLPPGDLTHWRQEGRTWVRVVPDHEAPVVRRVLDDEGNVVREEPATQADLDEVNGVKAERAVGKLLGGAGSAAGSAVAKLKTLRFKRGGDGK